MGKRPADPMELIAANFKGLRESMIEFNRELCALRLLLEQKHVFSPAEFDAAKEACNRLLPKIAEAVHSLDVPAASPPPKKTTLQ